MTRKQEYRELEEKLLTPEQLHEIRMFDQAVRRSDKRFNGLITCEADLDKDELNEYKNFSLE